MSLIEAERRCVGRGMRRPPRQEGAERCSYEGWGLRYRALLPAYAQS